MNSKYLIALVLGLFVILGGTLALLKQTGQNSNIVVVASALELSDTTHSWGTIPYDGGNQVVEFSLKNTGQDSVQLSDLRTSCMCTTAQVLVGDNQSPEIRMVDSQGWQAELQPNQLAVVRVEFDPAYHGLQGLGDIKRIITLKTNAQNYEQLEFSVEGTVIR